MGSVALRMTKSDEDPGASDSFTEFEMRGGKTFTQYDNSNRLKTQTKFFLLRKFLSRGLPEEGFVRT